MGFEQITGPNQLVSIAISTAIASAVASGVASGTTGFTLQTIYAETTALLSGTTTMAGGTNTIPVKTDGTQILSATITPKATTNTLLINFDAPMGGFSAINILIALFQDTTTSALAARDIGIPNTSLLYGAQLVYGVTANTTGPTTFKINVSNYNGVAATWVVNQLPGGGVLGGSQRATLTIQETKV